jgi:hypothetical protein
MITKLTPFLETTLTQKEHLLFKKKTLSDLLEVMNINIREGRGGQGERNGPNNVCTCE